MGLINLPNVDEIEQEKDPKKQMAMLVNTVGLLMKNLSELNGYLTTTNIKELHAKVIKAGTVTAEKMDVDELSAITANMGKLTSGEIYGAYIATREGAYPRVEMRNEDNLFGAYMSAEKFMMLSPMDVSRSAPAVIFRDGNIPMSVLLYIDPSLAEFNIGVTRNIRISGGIGGYTQIDTDLKIGDWTNLINRITSQTLQQALDSKVNKNSVTNLNGAHNHGIPNGATWETSAGTVMWSAAAAHAHNVT